MVSGTNSAHQARGWERSFAVWKAAAFCRDPQPRIVSPDRRMVKYSFIVPIYNDSYLAEEFCEEYQKVFRQHLGSENIETGTELIFVNDGSRDRSAEVLEQLPSRFPFVRVINLSRNFGQHVALSCGCHHA